MPVGMSRNLAVALLNSIGNNAAFTAGFLYAQLHVGDPGASGIANLAQQTNRVLVNVGTPTVFNVTEVRMISDGDTIWANVTANEDPTHISLWSATSGGVFRASGLITTEAYFTGDTFTIPAGAIYLNLQTAVD